MANTTITAAAVCPFYKSDNDADKSISCESVYGKYIATRFKSREDKYVHANKYCMTPNCKRCEIYRMVMRKYED